METDFIEHYAFWNKPLKPSTDWNGSCLVSYFRVCCHALSFKIWKKNQNQIKTKNRWNHIERFILLPALTLLWSKMFELEQHFCLDFIFLSDLLLLCSLYCPKMKEFRFFIVAGNYLVLSIKHFYLKISYLSLLFSAKSTSLSPTLLLRDRTKSAVFLSSYSSSSILSDQLSNVNYKKCLWYGIIPPISIENLFIGFTL